MCLRVTKSQLLSPCALESVCYNWRACELQLDWRACVQQLESLCTTAGEPVSYNWKSYELQLESLCATMKGHA